MKVLFKLLICFILISCGESESKTSSSSKSGFTSKQGEFVDFIKYENGNTRLKVFFDGDEIIQNIKKIEEFDINGKLYHVSEYNIDFENSINEFDPSLTTIYDPQGNEILRAKYFKEDDKRKIENVKISDKLNEHITKFWDTDLNSFYEGYTVNEKILKRFNNGDTREILRFIEYNNKKVPVERIIYYQYGYGDDKPVNNIETHQKLLGNVRRIRKHETYSVSGQVLSDDGIFSDDLKDINLKFLDEEIIVNVTYDTYTDGTSNISTVSVENFDTHFAFDWTSWGSISYFVRNSDNLITHSYLSDNDFNVEYEMNKTNLNLLINEGSVDFRTFPDEFLDNSKLSMYNKYSKDKFKYSLYKEEQRNLIKQSGPNILRQIYVQDSLTKRSDCFLLDKASMFYKSPTIMSRATEDNLMYKLYNLQNVQEGQIFGEYFHPNGEKMAELKVKFVGKLGYRRTDECSSKQYPDFHRIVTYYDDEGNQLGEAEFESYDNDIPSYVGFSFLSDLEDFRNNQQVSGDYFRFFYDYGKFSKQMYRKDLKNPVVWKVNQTSTTRKETRYQVESEYITDYPNSQYNKRYDHHSFVEGSLFLESETNYVKNSFYWEKEGKEILYGDKGVVIEEIEWKKGEKSDF